MKAKRVISLLPAGTEMVYALGAGELLVGRSHECDFPAEVKTLPGCTAAKFAPPEGGTPNGSAHGVTRSTSSVEINRQVGELMQKGESLYQIDSKLIQELRPDIIITQGQCEACAVSLREVEKMVSGWAEPRPQIVALSPNRLAEIWEDIRTVSRALDIEEHGREVLRGLKNRVVSIIEKTCVITKRPTVACIEWIEPLMAAGNWVPELVELAGGKDVIGQAGKHSAWMNWETLQQADPEIIVMMPCGFDLARTREETAALAKKPEWTKLTAVKKKRVYLVDGNQYFNRPGPRIVESLEILAEILQPGLFKFEPKGWEKNTQ